MNERPELKLRKTRPWTAYDDVQLKKMALAGESVALIASTIQRTGGATRNRARLLGISLAENVEFRAKRNAWLQRQTGAK